MWVLSKSPKHCAHVIDRRVPHVKEYFPLWNMDHRSVKLYIPLVYSMRVSAVVQFSRENSYENEKLYRSVTVKFYDGSEEFFNNPKALEEHLTSGAGLKFDDRRAGALTDLSRGRDPCLVSLV